jgi:ketosteroid isomerase-like protein
MNRDLLSNSQAVKGKAMRSTAVRVLAASLILSTGAGCATSGAQTSAKSVVQAKFAAVNRHSLEDIVALYAVDAELTAPDFCSPRRGRDDVRRTYKALFTAFPDISVEVQEYVQEGDRLAVRFIVRSNLPDRSFAVPIMNFFSVRDGLIVSDEGLFDTGGRKCSP